MLRRLGGGGSATIADGSITDAKLASGASGAKPITRTGVKTANYTAAMWDLVPCDTSGGAFTVTLPAASTGKGRVAIKLVTAGNILNLALTGSDRFNASSGATSGSLSLANQGIILESDGSSIWTITADDIPLTALDARYQPVDSDLTAIAALSTTTFGRSLLTSADAAAAKVTLGASDWITPSAATWYALQPGDSSSSAAYTVGRLEFWPVFLPAAMTVDSGQFETTVAASAGGTMRAAIYGATAAGLPDNTNKILDMGSVATDDAIGAHTYTFTSTTIPKGLVYLAMVPQTSVPTVRIMTAYYPPFALPQISTPTPSASFYGYARTGVTGALPTSGSVSVLTAGKNIKFYLHTT